MKALFVHDHIFYFKDEEIYSPGGLPSEAWNRYIQNLDRLYVVSRGNKDGHKEGLIKSSTAKVEFDLLYNVKGGLDYYKFKNQIIKKLRSYIEKVDFVIIRVPSTIGYFAYKLCMELNKPYVSEVVGCAWDSTWNYGALAIKLQGPIRFMQMRKIVKNSFAVTYVTEFFLQNRYPTNSKIIINASNVQIPNVLDEVREKHIYQLSKAGEEDVYKIGIIGNLNVKYKGFDVAMNALSILKRDNSSIKFQFFLVGGGNNEYVKSLITKYDLVEECVIIGRLQAGKEIFNFLDSLDLYIHPSKQEGLPRSVIEAMSRACPVLASTVAGIPELLNNEILHQPGDFKKLYYDLVTVLSNKEMRVSMAKNNFEKSKQYTQDLLEERRVNFFKSIVHELERS